MSITALPEKASLPASGGRLSAYWSGRTVLGSWVGMSRWAIGGSGAGAGARWAGAAAVSDKARAAREAEVVRRMGDSGDRGAPHPCASRRSLVKSVAEQRRDPGPFEHVAEQQRRAPQMLDSRLALLDQRDDHRVDRRRPAHLRAELHHLAVEIIDFGLTPGGEVVGHGRPRSRVDALDL